MKLPGIIPKIVELYKELTPLDRGAPISKYLLPAIYKEADHMLDELELALKDDKVLEEKLKNEKFKDILRLIERKERFTR